VFHNFPIRILISRVMEAFDRFRLDLAFISSVDLREEGDHLMFLNDICHLPTLPDRG
jgi:hypothetical protein